MDNLTVYHLHIFDSGWKPENKRQENANMLRPGEIPHKQTKKEALTIRFPMLVDSKYIDPCVKKRTVGCYVQSTESSSQVEMK